MHCEERNRANREDGRAACYYCSRIDTRTKQFRLLKINHGSAEVVEATLHVFDLDKAPPFQALSYTWQLGKGRRARRRRAQRRQDYMLTDGHIFNIGNNLSDFFKAYMRNSKLHSKYIWIDQICIDQDSTSERTHQVQLMEQIYSKAERVLAWVGESGDADVLEPFFQQLSAAYSMADVHHLLDEYVENWRVGVKLARFCHRSYWSRLWVLQELVLAKSCIVIYGHCTATLPQVCNLQGNLIHRPSWGRNYETHTLSLLWRQINLNRATDDLFMREMAVFTPQFSCEDPRDRLYAIQALLPPAMRIPVSYEKTVVQICAEACERMWHCPQDSHDDKWVALCVHSLASFMGLADRENSAPSKRLAHLREMERGWVNGDRLTGLDILYHCIDWDSDDYVLTDG